MTSIVDIEGIGPAIAEKLRKAGIRSTEALLDRCGTAKARKEVRLPQVLIRQDFSNG